MQAYQNIITEIEASSFIITINREQKLNALNIETLQEIKHAIIQIQSNTSIRGIIITGKGSKAFAAGADIEEFSNFNTIEGTKMSYDGHGVMNAIEQSAIPVIAAVNGFALGGGCELSMACHIRIASENAKFGQPEVNLGLPPGYAGTQRLISLIGKSRALELLLTAEIIDAQKALHYGLVSQVVNIDALLPSCKELINKLSKKSPMAIKMVIECVNMYHNCHNSGFEKEIELFGQSFENKDFKEGVSAFLEKRNANF